MSPFVESVPVTVSVNVPREEDLVFTESVLVPEVVTDDGEKFAFAPEGCPDTVNLTVPVYPFCGVTVMA